MAFENLSLPQTYFKYNECKKNQVLCEGIFDKEGEDKFGNPSWHIRGEETVYVLNSSGHLNYQMREEASLGDYLRVTYSGKTKLTRGKFAGKESHQFTVERDPDRSEKRVHKETQDNADESCDDVTL